MPKSNTTIIWTPISQCHVVRSEPKNYQQKDVFKEIDLHAQNMLTILGSTINIIGESI